MVMDPCPESPAAPPFELSGGHPVLDFVNTLDNRFDPERRRELLRDYGDLVRFAEQCGLLDAQAARHLTRSVSPRAATRALRSARELREALASLLYGHLEGRPPAAAEVRCLDRQFHQAARQHELHWQAAAASGHAMLRWQWGRHAKAADFPVWLLADVAAGLVMSSALERVSACGAETCRWLFLDASKNHTRRWCRMSGCGNRAKARRFQQRHAE
jgi:predicted RNA-binding Zn ribbon-like protein